MALVRADAIDVADILLLPFNGVRVSFSFTLFGGRAIVLIDYGRIHRNHLLKEDNEDIA